MKKPRLLEFWNDSVPVKRHSQSSKRIKSEALKEWVEDDYDRDYEDWELDEEHINLYGGDPTYCPECHERLSYGDGYPHCLNPECSRYSPIEIDEDYRDVKSESEAERYSDVVPYEQRKYWYFTKHGVGPGSIPKGVHVLDSKYGKNEKGTWGVYVLLDAVLNTSELKEFDIQESMPPTDTTEDDLTEMLHEDFDSDDSTVDETLVNNGMANEVIILMNDEWDTIKAYQNAIVNVDAYEVPNADGIKKVFNDILEEENKHVGQLQAILDELNNTSSDIQSGIEEGKEQLGSAEEVHDEEEVEIVADDDIDDEDEAFFNELLNTKVEDKDED